MKKLKSILSASLLAASFVVCSFAVAEPAEALPSVSACADTWQISCRVFNPDGSHAFWGRLVTIEL